MSSFTTPASIEIDDDKEFSFILTEPFAYHIGNYPSEEIITVPAGFVTDFASVPRALWWLFPPHGKYAKAAIVHDYLYVQAYKTKAFADGVFFEAMGVLGVPSLTRHLMYWAVRLFGRGSYA